MSDLFHWLIIRQFSHSKIEFISLNIRSSKFSYIYISIPQIRVARALPFHLAFLCQRIGSDNNTRELWMGIRFQLPEKVLRSERRSFTCIFQVVESLYIPMHLQFSGLFIYNPGSRAPTPYLCSTPYSVHLTYVYSHRLYKKSSN